MSESPIYVLVVDDDPDLLEMVTFALAPSGLEVTTAQSGAEALELFEARPAALCMLDVMMPELDGFELLQRLRQLPGGEDAMVIFVTALGDEGTQAQAAEAGADDFIAKPFHSPELLVRVHSMLAAYRMRCELRSCYQLIKAQVGELVGERERRREAAKMLVHDMRNLLLPVSMGISSALLQAPDDGHLKSAQRGASELTRLCDDLLDLEQGHTGNVPVAFAEVDLTTLVRGVCAVVAPRLRTKGLTMRIEGPEVRCYGDRNLLARAVGNLVDNAIRHAPRGSEVMVEIVQRDERIDVVVSDEGPGVPESDRERIFERYQRCGGKGYRGHGLGLAFCRMVAEVHGGDACVDPRSERTSLRLSLGSSPSIAS